MYGRNNSKRAVETFLVGTGNQALSNTANAGSYFITQATGVPLLASGQLGIIDASGYGSNTFLDFTDTTPTATESPVIQFVQGTANSADPVSGMINATYPLAGRAVEYSQPISAHTLVSATKKTPAAGTTSVWVTGQPDGTVGEIVSVSNTNYTARVAYRGRNEDEFFGPESAAHFTPHFITPDYTALGISTAALKRDHLIQNLVWDVDRNSKLIAATRTSYKGTQPLVALAISSSLGTGVEIGQGSPITAGDTIPVVSTNLGVRNWVLSSEEAESIKNAAVAASGSAIGALTWCILTVDLATAGTATGGVADIIMWVALNRTQAYLDYVPQLKTRLDIGLVSGFDYNTVSNAQWEEAYEGEGLGRQLALQYDSTHGQRKYNLQNKSVPVINYTNPIDTTDLYNTYIIEHIRTDAVDTFNTVESPMKEIILVPDEGTTTVTQLDTALAAWLGSINRTLVSI